MIQLYESPRKTINISYKEGLENMCSSTTSKTAISEEILSYLKTKLQTGML